MFVTNAKSFSYEGSVQSRLDVRRFRCRPVHIGCLSRAYELLAREMERHNACCLVPRLECCCVGLINGVQIKTVGVWMELDGQKEKNEREEMMLRKGLICSWL